MVLVWKVIHPIGFDMFPPKKRTRKTHPKAVTIDELTAWTNTKAVIHNAVKQGEKYKVFLTSHLLKLCLTSHCIF